MNCYFHYFIIIFNEYYHIHIYFDGLMVDPTLCSFSNAINSPTRVLVLSYLMMAYTAHMYSL